MHCHLDRRLDVLHKRVIPDGYRENTNAELCFLSQISGLFRKKLYFPISHEKLQKAAAIEK